MQQLQQSTDNSQRTTDNREAPYSRLDPILNLLFPVSCILCNSGVLQRKNGPVCPDCWGKTSPLLPPFCPLCGTPPTGPCSACRRSEHAFDFARSALLFNDPLREIIHHFKYSDRVSL